MSKRYALYVAVFSIPAVGLIGLICLVTFFFFHDKRKLRLVANPLDKVDRLEDEDDYNPREAPPEPLQLVQFASA